MDQPNGRTPKTLAGEHRATAGTVLLGHARPSDVREPRRRGVRRKNNRALRVEFLDMSLEKARCLLPSITTSQEFLRLTLAAAILIDRRRREGGRVTDRIEVRVSRPADRLARIMARLVSRSRRLNAIPQSH